MDGIEGSPRLGIWLMPDNGSAGEIEDFVSNLIRPGDPLWPRAERYIDEIPLELRPFAEGKVIRAKLYAWLATRKEPRRMGQAILAGDIATDHQSVATFAQWLTRTFAGSAANPPAAPPGHWRSGVADGLEDAAPDCEVELLQVVHSDDEISAIQGACRYSDYQDSGLERADSDAQPECPNSSILVPAAPCRGGCSNQ